MQETYLNIRVIAWVYRTGSDYSSVLALERFAQRLSKLLSLGYESLFN